MDRTRNRRGPRGRVPRERVDAAIRDGARKLLADCEIHGWTTFVIERNCHRAVEVGEL